METKPKNIYQKLLVIQNRIGGLGKDKKSFGFDYVTGNKVLDHIKPIMNEVGLLLKQEIISIENTRQDYKTKSGETSEINSKVMMRFTWVDTETGEKDENLFGANGQNAWDKGVGSALTYSERYFLLKYFHIATDEDDIDNPERKKSEPATKAPKAPPAAPQMAVSAEQPAPAATAQQKARIIELANSPCIEKEARKKMLSNVGKISEARAVESIANLEAAIKEKMPERNDLAAELTEFATLNSVTLGDKRTKELYDLANSGTAAEIKAAKEQAAEFLADAA